MRTISLVSLAAAGCFDPGARGKPCEDGMVEYEDVCRPERDGDADTDADADADADADTDADTDTDPGAPVLAGIEPAWDLEAGGATVTLSGSNLDADPVVRFGDAEATVLSAAPAEVVVRAPEGAAGTADVTVTTTLGEDALPGAWTWFADATGLWGTYGEFGWYDVVGGYWDDDTDFGSAGVWFVEPDASAPWNLYADAIDTCTADAHLGYETLELGGPATLVLGSPRGDVTLDWDEGGFYVAELSSTEWFAEAALDLEPIDFPGWPSLAVPAFVETPEAMTVTSPSLSGPSLTTVSRSALDVRWNAGSGDDVVVMVLQLLSADGASVADEITCAAADDGAFQVPAAAWSGWSANRTLTFTIGRLRLSDAEIPFNHARSGVTGGSWVLGAAVTR